MRASSSLPLHPAAQPGKMDAASAGSHSGAYAYAARELRVRNAEAGLLERSVRSAGMLKCSSSVARLVGVRESRRFPVGGRRALATRRLLSGLDQTIIRP